MVFASPTHTPPPAPQRHRRIVTEFIYRPVERRLLSDASSRRNHGLLPAILADRLVMQKRENAPVRLLKERWRRSPFRTARPGVACSRNTSRAAATASPAPIALHQLIPTRQLPPASIPSARLTPHPDRVSAGIATPTGCPVCDG